MEMARYPISHNGSKRLGEYFKEILEFHMPPSNVTRILDPTCGKKHLWTDFYTPTLKGDIPLNNYGEVFFSDIMDYGQDVVLDLKDLHFDEPFNCIVYDPPYFFGYKGSTDPRRKDYGDYIQEYNDLIWFMDFANEKFPNWLTDDGKLILKCADQYQTKERKFYPHHYTWINKLTNFNIIDLMIFTHHRISPTAFQVKERPCSVIMHTYFLVFNKRIQ
jgi:hypothetical protein